MRHRYLHLPLETAFRNVRANPLVTNEKREGNRLGDHPPFMDKCSAAAEFRTTETSENRRQIHTSERTARIAAVGSEREVDTGDVIRAQIHRNCCWIGTASAAGNHFYGIAVLGRLVLKEVVTGIIRRCRRDLRAGIEEIQRHVRRPDPVGTRTPSDSSDDAEHLHQLEVDPVASDVVRSTAVLSGTDPHPAGEYGLTV